MKIIMPGAGCLALWVALSVAAFAAENCPAQSQQINDSNSLMMLGGTAKGPVKQVVVGEFGKDVNQQKRILGQFDRCGALIRADISYDKNEGALMLRMVQSIARASGGWQAVYDMSVYVVKEGKPVEVNRKQGTIDYLVSPRGIITSATDAFMLRGKKGFTETTNTFDPQLRLIKSVARGSDTEANGEYLYQWNSKNQLVASLSANSKMTWSYDKQDREQRLTTTTHSDNSEMVTVDECQLWDERGNCTLSYSHETEVFAEGEVNRNISAAYRFEYWEK